MTVCRGNIKERLEKDLERSVTKPNYTKPGFYI